MVLVKNRTEELGFYISPDIGRELLRAKTKVEKYNQDRVYVIDGREGHGKSTLGLQLAYSFDPQLTLDQVVFNGNDFEEITRKLPKFRSVVFDEAFNGLSSKSAMSRENKKLVRLLMEVRQRNLFIFIVLPSIFLLEKYVAIFRSQALFHCYIGKKGNNRFYKRYNYQNKKLLYINGKKLMAYHRPKVSFTHRFFDKYPKTIDRAEYNKKKLLAFRDIEKEDLKEDKRIKQRTIFSKLLKDEYKLSYSKQAELLKLNDCGVDYSTLADCARNAPLIRG